ncbi:MULTISPECIES: aminotransferase class V-fold PLP-dependent enzyme [unclassified Streptomyces]|uniref:pyridoxal phosphate-dependent decarboxylase family protein n=1 Tax=Streptomyces TaxID=1883 RepID=UPI0001C1CBB4|nr:MULTISPECIES: aminotransferase class V-fold PLP-dependent enzyme [unclassified Streptomyces]MYR66431.1 aminotransferase class V-fold PLP-dependent enzyme [Streptomyces sp. SID4939]MYS04859.1 aminotransferase class V-fold PLP-dependent enzyme [Streptomyces sp. SID4940]MYT64183.1 aminotransferase class V-fold PLP-dependent enzyme [Streptomyces sp. SID8357]MYT86996.1 aminotransferase class V-fold PLP-dependent enzyme [Streptomyces sp. SID8360]MYW37441.1 aminotransferase class V-fold PLP-depend
MPTEPPDEAALPDGRPAADVLAELRALREGDAPTRGGRTFAYVYDAGLEGLDELAAEAYTAFATVNGLDPTVFPSVARLENDLIGAVAALLGAPGAQGTFTSGGTESILLAVKAARDQARSVRGISRPQLVLPATAHAAFHKAAAYLGVEPVVVPVDPDTFRADADAMAAALTDRTALVVASAPSYAHGVIDPVAEIAAAAAGRGALCHVDACIGGWILPYLRRAGRQVRPFDLSVPGVTSLSVDLHKYAYADKGASVLLHRDAELRRHQYFAHAGWPGYPVVNPTVQGTKSAGLLAQAWAVLRHVGEDGYTALAGRVADASDRLLSGLRATEGVRVLGDPAAGLVAFTVLGPGDGGAPDLSLLLHLADEMRELGWYLQPQLSFDGLPPNLHLTLTPATVGQVDALLEDLGTALTVARSLEPVTVDPGLAELAAALDPRALGPDEVAAVLAFAGLGEGGGLPGRMAPVLVLLDALPNGLKERLLAEFIGSVFHV